MPTATNTHTTSTRRGALRFSASAIIAGLMTPATADAKSAQPASDKVLNEIACAWRKAWDADLAETDASSLDAELIALAEDHKAANAEIRRLEKLPVDVDDSIYKPLDRRRWDAIDSAGDAAAVTLAGIRAKASIFMEELDLTECREGLDKMEYLAMTIARDLLDLGAGGAA